MTESSTVTSTTEITPSSTLVPDGFQEPALPPHGLSIVSANWPHLIIGVVLAMGILSLNPDEPGKVSPLIWLPPAVLVGWIFLNIVFAPRPPKPESEMGYHPDYDAGEDEDGDVDHALMTAGDGGAIAPAKPVEAVVPAAPAGGSEDASLEGFNGVLILWGSETGTAEGLANGTQARLAEAGIEARSIDAGKVTLAGLEKVQRLLVLTSTWGDGEPPSNATALWESLQKGKADLSKVKFSVLSLGDTGYPQFCQCGKDFDNFLPKHGAQRLADRVDCDLEYEENYEKWVGSVMAALKANPVPV